MIIKNASTKTITLVNGKQLGPKESLKIEVKKGTLYLLEIPQDIYLSNGPILQHTNVFT